MTRIKFSDGFQLETSGEYRVARRRGGYYVVGHSLLCPVTGRADGERLIADLNAARRKRLGGGRPNARIERNHETYLRSLRQALRASAHDH